ncbi:Bax inhibitor-1/YccA family protein [Aureibaculum sp. A20]|uniref:Bax inhibitor-1/YccA family protein n=1 Tax=Aureibaculum flavum TaxID=2795986 RepID=A0ABS0WSE6_9FLAO|nr:Bax inhibitor-1/YccA family protein [Aureibaculum flavum]MBJ2174846.1 Bax inhibitor-1/YccA family protein [Aureibaculum flavum]
MAYANYNTSNPVFSSYIWKYNRSSASKMTLNGVIIKSIFSLVLVGLTTWYVWDLVNKGEDVQYYTYGGMIAAIVFSIITSYKKKWSPITTPLYALSKGLFLGGISAYAEAKFEGMPMRAVGVTLLTFFIMLILYKARIVIVTKRFRSVLITAIITIMSIYIISWILNIFGINTPYIWGTSWFAIGFNIIAAIVASFSLLLDFDFIDRKINKAPKYYEWVATWGLLVTLIWLYVEVIRLMKKLAIRF